MDYVSDSKDIRKLFDAWNAALQTGDPEQVVDLYAFNAILLPTVSNKVRHTRAEIRDYFVHFLKNHPKGKIDESNVRIYNGIAINSGIYTFTLKPTGGDKVQVQARFTYVYQWFGDRWLIIEHHSSKMPETVAPGSTKTAAKKKSVN
ncbi:MAG: hypothetical protein RL610_566 [Pseudomonadota bacterium]|jgi:uncharacterized protein (TIGR02246 family)